MHVGGHPAKHRTQINVRAVRVRVCVCTALSVIYDSGTSW